MGGKSRKTGGVSKALINRIINKRGGGSCGSKRKISVQKLQDQSRGLLDDIEEE